MTKELVFDSYERRARIVPGLMLVLPVPIAIASLGLRGDPVVAACASLLSLVGGPFLLAAHVRQRGLDLQDKLYEKWNGAPTTILLRLRSDAEPGPIQAKYRADTQQATGQFLPTWQEQEASAATADERYQVAVSVLRKKTAADRQKHFLVFEELRNYGFERNLRAVRAEAIVLCVAGAAVLGGAIAVRSGQSGPSHTSDLVIGLIVLAALLLFWIFWPSERRVRRAGDLYAERLFDSAPEI